MKKYISLVIVVFLLISLVGCSKKSDNEEIAQTFVKKVLTLPDENINKIVGSDLHITDIEKYNLELKNAADLLSGEIASEKLKSGDSRFFQEVIMLHAEASLNKFTYQVDSVEMSKINDKQYSYTANIITSKSKEMIKISGSIQFDDENKIEFMSIY